MMKSNRLHPRHKLPPIATELSPDEVFEQFLSKIRDLNHRIERVFIDLQNMTTTDERKTVLTPLEDDVIAMNDYIAGMMEYLQASTRHLASISQTTTLSWIAEFTHHIREQISPLRGYLTVYLHYEAPMSSLDQRLNGIVEYGRGVGEVLDAYEMNRSQ